MFLNGTMESVALAEESAAGDVRPEVIGGLLFQAHQLARAAANEAMRPYGVELRHLALMGYLVEHGPQSQRQLGTASGVDKSTMVRAIDELEERGLVARRRSVSDRRVYEISVTAEGKRRMRAASKHASGVMDGLLAPLAAAERRQLTDLLARFVAHARDRG
jgi:DNA-binding MarR family transcriptional regulator